MMGGAELYQLVPSYSRWDIMQLPTPAGGIGGLMTFAGQVNVPAPPEQNLIFIYWPATPFVRVTVDTLVAPVVQASLLPTEKSKVAELPVQVTVEYVSLIFDNPAILGVHVFVDGV